jgi:hypothetical protein
MAHPGVGQSACTRQVNGFWEAKTSVYELMVEYSEAMRRLTINRVAVEKLLPAKFAKIKLHQDALQTTFSVFLDIFYPQNFGYFDKREFFNSHSRLHSMTSGQNM